MLLGIGHTNAHIVREWGKNPIPNWELVCVSNFPTATYSGMLPAVLAGQIPPKRMEIDLRALCDIVGAKLLVGTVTGLTESNELEFENNPNLKFDVLSIGVGSVPATRGMELAAEACLPIKPMQTFLDRLKTKLERLQFQRGNQPLQISVIGGGVAGCEVALCLDQRLKTMTGVAEDRVRIIHAGDDVLGNETDGLKKRIRQVLDERDIELSLTKRVKEVTIGQIHLEDQTVLSNDFAVIVTGADPPPLLGILDLPKDERGFLATHPTLQSTSGRPIFVVGDSGTIINDPAPKAGVYAVREGPVLWENVNRLIANKPLRNYSPQRSFLKLMNLGDGRAVGEWRGMSFQGRWAMWLKSVIDGAFMAKFQKSPDDF